MSYQFYVTPTVTITSKLMPLMYELGARDTTHLIELLEEKYSIYSEKDWTEGYERLEARPAFTAPEHEGLDEIAQRLSTTLFAVADPGVYTIVDEYDRELEVTVHH